MPSENARYEPLAVCIDEAALLIGLSQSQVREYRRTGPLVPAVADGRQAVTLESLRRLIAQRRAMRIGKARGRTRLRLVVDNS